MVANAMKEKRIECKFSNRERRQSKKGFDEGSRTISKSVREFVGGGKGGELSTQRSISRVLVKIREFESPLASSGDIISISRRPDKV